jgi:hypothetical protein
MKAHVFSGSEVDDRRGWVSVAGVSHGHTPMKSFRNLPSSFNTPSDRTKCMHKLTSYTVWKFRKAVQIPLNIL